MGVDLGEVEGIMGFGSAFDGGCGWGVYFDLVRCWTRLGFAD